jgi:UDP-N-acetylglucosamine acyltransferase
MNYIHPTAVIGPNVLMGDNNYIGPFCIIGFPAEHKEFWRYRLNAEYVDFPFNFCGKVIIGNNNVFTGHVTVDAGTERETIIRNNVWALKHSHVGHDAHIGDDVTISCGAKVGGHAIIGNGCNIGLNAVIHQRQEIREGCMIGMGAAVTKGLITEPFRKYAGVPAKDIGSNEC